MFMENLNNVNSERLIIALDHVNIECWYNEGVLCAAPADPKLNLWVLCPEDDPSSFRGYAGQLFIIHCGESLVVSTNLWHMGTIKAEVTIERDLVSVFLTDLKWRVLDSKEGSTFDKVGKYCYLTGINNIKCWYKDGWHYLEQDEIDKKYHEAKKYVALDAYFNRKEG